MSFIPAWSIVIPTYGRGHALPGLLESLAALQSPAGGFEVILVDDGSPEPLDSIVDPFTGGDLNLTLVRKTNGGPAGARNLGVEKARGRWVALTDDDCRPYRDWLIRLAEAVNETPNDMIGGQTDNGLPDNLYSESSQLLVDYLYHYDRRNNDGAQFITSNNMAMARADFIDIGGFDENFPLAAGEDRDFCDRWQRSGRSIRVVSSARIDHFHALSATGFWRQHRNYGRGAVRVHDVRRSNEATSTRFERLSFYATLVAYPVTAGVDRPWRKTLLMAASQVATTEGYLRQWWRQRR